MEISVQMKHYVFFLLVATQFSAQAETIDWSSCSAGLSVGYGQGSNQWTTTYFNGTSYQDNAGSANSYGALTGGQLGCDLQRANWVMGVQATLHFADLKGNHRYVGGTATDTASYKTNGLWTLAGRIGYLFTPRTLAYIKAGRAWVDNEYHDADPNAAPAYHYQATKIREGGLLGLGIEYRYTQKISLFAELNKINLGKEAVSLNHPNGYRATMDQDLTTLTSGFNYRF